MTRTVWWLGFLLVVACDEQPAPSDAGAPPADAADAAFPDAAPPPMDAGPDRPDGGPPGPDAGGIVVLVTLDGEPLPDALVLQGGREDGWRTGPDGRVRVELDEGVVGDRVLIASHPEARIQAVKPFSSVTATIALERFDRSDNPDYAFQDPGEPSRRPNTTQCGHCHLTIDDDWFGSPHRTSASNPHLWAIYEELPAGETGGCADCHAPGIDGALFGRDLRDASGFALDYGVHCDVCHRVEDVVVGAAPAFGGWLVPMRPSEPGPVSLGAGGFFPLTFGPSHDSPNPRMGSVQRDHFREARLCGGCHQLEQGELAGSIDRTRWPDGRIPIHTTYAEWEAGPMNGVAPCQSCHMPPAPTAANGADLQLHTDAVVGVRGGWYRPPGSVRRHSFIGPRTPSSRMLELAAAIFLDKSVAGGVVTATVTVKNVSAGHALPTGEPLRSMILLVDARCGASPLAPVGGDAIPWFGGAISSKTAAEDWSDWPSAQIGDVVRVVRLGDYIDYAGFGPFGDGTFDAAEKGLAREIVVGSATVTAVAPIAFDRPLPAGDVAYLTRDEGSAGQPGFAFARVLADPTGRTMVPHAEATDVVVDNRLMPQASASTVHQFDTPCPDPIVHARLLYRRFPTALARARGWAPGEATMAEATR